MTQQVSASQSSPWPALWSMMVGFFMILVDSTIVAVAIPAIAESLNATYNGVIWVNSAYLLAYAVPLLITGRLGDRFGPKRLYMLGLAVFTVSSLACGLAGSVGVLIAARAFQGLGGAMLTPQTMSVMIRTFSPTQRGSAMGVWGAVAGVATIVGPLLGGIFVDLGGWEWIFIINVPFGIIGLLLAWKNVPKLELTARRLDWLGVALSAVGMFCLIFGIQEGSNFNWDVRAIGLIVIGVVFIAAFIMWQARTTRDALVPLSLFADRNFALASAAITTVGFAVSTFAIPLMIYVQRVQNFSPTVAALLLLPSGLVSGALSGFIGKQTNTHDPKPFAITGLAVTSISIFATVWITDPQISPYWMLLISVFYGLGNSMIWGPLSMIATRNLDPALAGAGSSVYNTVRQVGAVIGSAAVAAAMSSQLAQRLGDDAAGHSETGPLPEFLHEPFAEAMSVALLLPAGVLVLGVAVAALFAKTRTWSDN
ncbi:DHA2 family efflux MFS transporter permease subunit [Corynebacterium sp. Marseille-P3884]|uniref:DHA2 family efflux MFS transporter permease subunit n=1 Tax=Corynebacterium sp. Marseille-P3884 TaxID=2495409 RepID=UPI001FF0DED4|nr:DHA2 family efflux MFS transporter permease subunit [Corynebacterium sp. Marseille-P3884]